MRSVDVIGGKRDGRALTREEIDLFVSGVTSGAWPDYQASALLMAIVIRGMTDPPGSPTPWFGRANAWISPTYRA
jgi:pyrimidine-nucleoside phosphorylase